MVIMLIRVKYQCESVIMCVRIYCVQTYDELLADNFEIVEAGENPKSYSKSGAAIFSGLSAHLEHPLPCRTRNLHQIRLS